MSDRYMHIYTYFMHKLMLFMLNMSIYNDYMHIFGSHVSFKKKERKREENNQIESTFS